MTFAIDRDLAEFVHHDRDLAGDANAKMWRSRVVLPLPSGPCQVIGVREHS